MSGFLAAKSSRSSSKQVDLKSLVEKCVNDSGGKNMEASELLQSMGNADIDVYRAIMNDSYADRCYFLVSAVIRAKNRALRESQARAAAAPVAPKPKMESPVSSPKVPLHNRSFLERSKAHIAVAHRKVAVSCMDLTFQGYGRLADMSGAQVLLAAEEEKKTHKVSGIKARLLTALGSNMRPEQIVKEVFTAERVDAMYQEFSR